MSLRTAWSCREDLDHDYTLVGSPADFAACASLAGKEVAVVAAEVGETCCAGRNAALKFGVELRLEGRIWHLRAPHYIKIPIVHCPWCGGKLAEGGGV
jgi:NAD(P)H-nitrite reductase large subunit